MKQYYSVNTVKFIGALLLVLTLGCLGQPANATAEDVVLNPGYISGSFQIGQAVISQGYISASSGVYTSSTSTLTNNYTLTVNTPLTNSYGYNVASYAYTDSRRDYIRFKKRSVTVSGGETVLNNYFVTPGIINGTVTNSGSASLYYGYIYAFLDTGEKYTDASTYFDSNGLFSFPVQPNENIRVYGTVYFRDSRGTFSVSLSAKNVTVAADGTVSVNWNLNANIRPPLETGSITGDFTLNGIDDLPFRHQVSSYRTAHLSNNGPYTLSNIPTGYWYVSALTSFPSYGAELRYPYSCISPQKVHVPDGGTATSNISADAAFISGKLNLTGTKSIQDANYVKLYAYGSNALTYGGSASDNINKTTGAYDLVVTPGSWDLFYSYYWFYESATEDDYIKEDLDHYDYTQRSAYGGTPVSLTAGETVIRDLTYETGTVSVVNFSVIGGDSLSNPHLYGFSSDYDENQKKISSTTFSAYGHPNQDKVTFVAMPGTYTVTAKAYVGGAYTTFGKLNIDVFPGTDVVIDIGGLTLSMESPEPEYYTTDSSVEVSGKANDYTKVESVTVNGVPVSLTSTNNNDEPHEVSFSTNIALDYGPNSIKTIATNTTDGLASDTRNIYRDSGPPTLNWTPADGTVTSNEIVTVTGTATDDNEITKVTINGEEASFSSTNNPDDPNEVGYSANVALNEGPNQIVVMTHDNCKRVTSQTHTVTKIINRPPTADAGTDQTVVVGVNCEVVVTLNGNGSSDPDGDELSYLWEGSFGIVSGSQPKLTLAKGTHIITLTVSDGTLSDTDSVIITVIDTTPPELSVSPDKNELWPANHKYVTISVATQATDICDTNVNSNVQLVSVTSDEPEDAQGIGNKKDGGDGNTTHDIIIIDNNTVKLRAERLGGSDGRVYTFNYSVTDESGNNTKASAITVVPNNPNKAAVDSGVKYTVKP